MKEEMTNGEILMKGGVGTGSTLGAWWVANIHHINAELQMISLLLGIAIGTTSLFKLIRKNRKNKPNEK